MITIEELKIFLQSGVFNLYPTQNKLCFPIIRRIHHKMNLGVPFDDIHVDKELLIDGHHRYICSLLLKKNINSNLWASPSKIIVYEWPQIEIDPNDWEKMELIQRHNLADALKSGLSINEFDV